MASLGDILRIVAGLSFNAAVEVQNVYYVKVSDIGGIPDEDIPDDMGEYLEDIYDGLVSSYPNNVTFETFKVTNVTADVDLGTHPWPSLTAGSGAQETYAPGVALLTLARTATPHHAGRKYWGPFQETSMSDGTWASAIVSGFAAVVESVYNAFAATSGNDYQPIVYDRENDVGRLPVELTVSSNPAYQRRRRVGTGA